jgi:integrase/recombinase XerD
MIRSTSSREMVSLAPLRLRNFAGLSLGHSLMRQGSIWWIPVPGTETKNHRPYERPFPERLLPALQRYLDEVRPALLQRKGRWARPVGSALWVSCHGSPLSEAAIHQQIVAYTAVEFGEPVNPHRFRHSAATSLALVSPEAVRSGALVLGHTSYATAERHYNLARAVDAGRRYQEVLEANAKKRKR